MTNILQTIIIIIIFITYFIDHFEGKLNCNSASSQKLLNDILGIRFYTSKLVSGYKDVILPNPGKSVSDEHMKICYNGLTENVQSCCTSKAEEIYRSKRVSFQLKKYLQFDSPTVNNLKILATKLENNFHIILKKSIQETEELFIKNELFQEIPDRVQGPLKKLNTIIRNYISSSVSQSKVNSGFRVFLQELFPAMIFPEARLNLFKLETIKCIENTSFNITLLNKPFEGESARPLLKISSKAIAVERSLIHNVQIVSQVLNDTIYNYKASSWCSHALVRLHLCPACMGLQAPVEKDICQPFCQATLADCLRFLSPLGQALNRFNKNINRLLKFSNSESGLHYVLPQMPHYISMAIQAARLKLNMYRLQLGNICNVNVTIFKDLPSFTPLLERDNATIHKFLLRQSAFSQFNFTDIFPKLVDRHCANLPLRHCWNGQEVAPLGVNTSWTWNFNQFGKSTTSSPDQVRQQVELKLNKLVDKIVTQNKHIDQLLSTPNARKHTKAMRRKTILRKSLPRPPKKIICDESDTLVDDEDILDVSSGSGGSGSGMGCITSTIPRLQHSTKGDEQIPTVSTTEKALNIQKSHVKDKEKICKKGEKEPCENESLQVEKPFTNVVSSNGGCHIYPWNFITFFHILIFITCLKCL